MIEVIENVIVPGSNHKLSQYQDGDQMFLSQKGIVNRYLEANKISCSAPKKSRIHSDMVKSDHLSLIKK